jgi:hypothetical protein
MFPHTCAQEGCACRDAAFVKVPNVPVPNTTSACKNPKSPMLDRCPGASGWMLNHPCYECYPDIATGSADGMHNAHPDLAFAAYSFRNAVRFARLLGVDSSMSMFWQAALDNMPDYPSADFTFLDGAVGSEFNGGAGFLVEAQYGYQPGVFPNGSSVAPPLWPWCNKEYVASSPSPPPPCFVYSDVIVTILLCCTHSFCLCECNTSLPTKATRKVPSSRACRARPP